MSTITTDNGISTQSLMAVSNTRSSAIAPLSLSLYRRSRARNRRPSQHAGIVCTTPATFPAAHPLPQLTGSVSRCQVSTRPLALLYLSSSTVVPFSVFAGQRGRLPAIAVRLRDWRHEFRLRELKLKSKDDVCNFSWMITVMDLLSDTRQDVKSSVIRN